MQKTNHEQSPDYEKPAIIWEQSLDVRALAVACGKINPEVDGDCFDAGGVAS